MDSLGHVNHTIYIKWMETARMHYFNACGFSDLYETQGVGPILAALEVEYKRPLVFGDTVTVRTRMTRLGRASFEMDYRLTSKSEQGALVATGTARLVVYDFKASQSVPLSDEMRSSIKVLEAKGFTPPRD